MGKHIQAGLGLVYLLAASTSLHARADEIAGGSRPIDTVTPPVPSVTTTSGDPLPSIVRPEATGRGTPIPRALPSASVAAPQKFVPPPSDVLPTPSIARKTPVVDPMIKPASASDANAPETSLATSSSNPATMNVAAPCLQIVQSAPEQITPGTPSTIEITLTNRGSVPVDQVIVTDAVDPTLKVISTSPKAEVSGTTLVWSIPRIDAGETKTMSFSVAPVQAGASEMAIARASVTFSSAVQSEIKLAAANVEIAMNGPDKATVGQPTEITIVVTNKGNALADNVILKGTLPEGLAHSEGSDLEYEVGELPPGESRSVPLSLLAKSAGTHTCTIAAVAGLQRSEATFNMQVQDFRLTIDAEGPANRYLNQACSYKLKLANIGEAPAPETRLQVTLPAGLTFAAASDGGRTEKGNLVVWSLPSCPPGQSKELTLTCVATQLGSHQPQAVLSAGERILAETKVNTTIKGLSALSLEVVDRMDPVEIAGETIFEIHVVNQGTLPATNVVVSCQIPEELEAIAADGPTSQTLQNSLLSFEPLSQIAPKGEAVYRVKCIGRKEGSARLKTTVRTAEISEPIVEEESTTVFGS